MDCRDACPGGQRARRRRRSARACRRQEPASGRRASRRGDVRTRSLPARAGSRRTRDRPRASPLIRLPKRRRSSAAASSEIECCLGYQRPRRTDPSRRSGADVSVPIRWRRLAGRRGTQRRSSAPALPRSAATQSTRWRRTSAARAGEILEANAQDVAEATALIDRLTLNEQRSRTWPPRSSRSPICPILSARHRQLDAAQRAGDLACANPDRCDRHDLREPAQRDGRCRGDLPPVRQRRHSSLRCRRRCAARWPSAERLPTRFRTPGFHAGSVQLVPTADRAAVASMLEGLSGTIDLIIPRGGRSLVERVTADARVPVLGHLEGVCHTYVHHSADPTMAAEIVRNAKLRRVTVCGATETLLIDRDVAPTLLPLIADALDGCELRGDAQARAIVPMAEATDADWRAEYLAPILAVKTVDDDRRRDPAHPTIRNRPHRGHHRRRHRGSRIFPRPTWTAQSCCGTPRPNTPTAASSGLAARSASPPASCTRAVRLVRSS